MTEPEPTVWTVTYPPEPGPEVTAVRDNEDDVWTRNEHGWSMPGCRNRAWSGLFEWQPLTDATHEPTTEETTT